MSDTRRIEGNGSGRLEKRTFQTKRVVIKIDGGMDRTLIHWNIHRGPIG